jgi:ribonuclease P protein component
VLHARRRGGEELVPPVPRLTVVAGRRFANAVARNRARRRLKAAAAELLPLHARPGTDYVLIARMDTLTRPYPDLLQDLEAALRRLRCYVEDADAEAAAEAGAS